MTVQEKLAEFARAITQERLAESQVDELVNLLTTYRNVVSAI